MLIISDTSALSALAEAGLMSALPAVFPMIVITESVRHECTHPGAPVALQEWAKTPPSWVQIASDPPTLLPETTGLGIGEATSISLAWEHRPESTVILDDREGRALAKALGLNFIGLLGVVAIAAQRKAIRFDEAISKLQAVDFRMSEEAIQICRVRAGQ